MDYLRPAKSAEVRPAGRVVKKGKAVELPPQGSITFGAVELTLARYKIMATKSRSLRLWLL